MLHWSMLPQVMYNTPSVGAIVPTTDHTAPFSISVDSTAPITFKTVLKDPEEEAAEQEVADKIKYIGHIGVGAEIDGYIREGTLICTAEVTIEGDLELSFRLGDLFWKQRLSKSGIASSSPETTSVKIPETVHVYIKRKETSSGTDSA